MPGRALVAGLALGSLAFAGAVETDPLRTAETAASKWVDLRAETSRLEAEWAAQKPLLESFVHALDNRAQALETKRDFLQAKGAREAGEIAALESGNRAALAATDAAQADIGATVQQLIALRPSLPPRLSNSLDLAFRSLAKPDASVNERMQTALTILSRCQVFNHNLNYAQEVLALPGESNERLLEVVYWGLGQGYALDRSSGKAWVGRPDAGIWSWQAQPDAAVAIAQLVAIVRDEANPALVSLPAQLGAARR